MMTIARDDIQEDCIMSGELRTTTQEDRVDVAFQHGTHARTNRREKARPSITAKDKANVQDSKLVVLHQKGTHLEARDKTTNALDR
jgi:glucan phosphoethanolaminetransferase (alkaline phosphatase superfamily)